MRFTFASMPWRILQNLCVHYEKSQKKISQVDYLIYHAINSLNLKIAATWPAGRSFTPT